MTAFEPVDLESLEPEPMPAPVALPPVEDPWADSATETSSPAPVTPLAGAGEVAPTVTPRHRLRIARAALANIDDQLHVVLTELRAVPDAHSTKPFARTAHRDAQALLASATELHVAVRSLMEKFDQRGVK